jgi:hypothetical protein
LEIAPPTCLRIVRDSFFLFHLANAQFFGRSKTHLDRAVNTDHHADLDTHDCLFDVCQIQFCSFQQGI